MDSTSTPPLGAGAPEPIPAKILVVDDNAQNLALVEATLEDEGYDVVLAANGEAGLRAVESERPACVLLDVHMPRMDGFAVCARIRALPEGADTPVVFLTALGDAETFEQARRVGGDDFLTKPVRPSELVLRVQAALERHRRNADLRSRQARPEPSSGLEEADPGAGSSGRPLTNA